MTATSSPAELVVKAFEDALASDPELPTAVAAVMALMQFIKCSNGMMRVRNVDVGHVPFGELLSWSKRWPMAPLHLVR